MMRAFWASLSGGQYCGWLESAMKVRAMKGVVSFSPPIAAVGVRLTQVGR